MSMHRILQRQLTKLGLSDAGPPNAAQWQTFLQRIDNLLSDGDNERYNLQRSLSISSDEMQSLYQRQRESYEARLEGIVSVLPDVLLLLDEDGKYIEVLAGDENDLLLPADELKGRYVRDVVQEEVAEQVMEVIHDTLEVDHLLLHVYQVTAGEETRRFEGRVVPSKVIVDGKRTVVWLARNVTAEHDADRRSRLLNMVLEAATEGIVIVRNDKRVLYANPAIAEITGYSTGELIMEGQGFLRHELDEAVCEMICAEASAANHLQREILLHRKNGETRLIWLNLDTLRNEQQEIEYYVGVMTDVTAIKRSREELEHVATHDAVTGLANRLYFEDRLNQAVAHAKRAQQSSALYFLDLDRFKSINDSLGHPIGDEVLREVAARLRQICRTEDTVARFGGDEFGIIVEQLESEADAIGIAEKLLECFSTPVMVNNKELTVSGSIGVTRFPDDGDDAQQLLKQADAAMYAAKDAGRNCFRWYAAHMVQEAERGLDIEIGLRRALENGELFLEYQPQYLLPACTELAGFEALLRWRHPQHGIVSPLDFIPVAERTGQIEAIGLWVFETVCKTSVAWRKAGAPFKRLSFNLSQRQLVDPELPMKFVQVLDDSGADPADLEVEITESAIIRQQDLAHRNLSALVNKGLALAIDDFGTGHSSLINLKRFPLSRLKVDRTFVRDVGKDPNDESIIRATISLARSFGMEVTAEGVENELQHQFLAELGCNDVQGFLFGKPMPVDDALALMMPADPREQAG